MNSLSANKANQITHEIQQLWIYQNKSIDTARKEVFSRHTPQEVAGYLAFEREQSEADARRSDTKGTY